jgi:hypothetical protein
VRQRRCRRQYRLSVPVARDDEQLR